MAKSSTTKRVLIDKANTRLVVVTSVATFLFIFSAVASKALISQAGYQNRVIGAKKEAVKQLKADVTASQTLNTSYKAFVSTSQNVIGGNPGGTGPKDGNNAELVLDALPSSYDFPALATSLEKIATSQNVTIKTITGIDDEVAQGGNTSSGTPQAVAMPFEIAVKGNYQAVQGVVGQFEHSIRPFQVQKIDLSGDQGNMTMDITAQTFYQPAKKFNIGSKVVK